MVGCPAVTWIVGGPGFSVPFLAGDICVTFAYDDGTEVRHDCLQKIYPIARNVLAGFAGSVDFGLRILRLAAQGIRGSDYLDLPKSASEWFPGLARQHFSEAPEAEQEGGCQILMVGMHPILQQHLIPTPRTDAVRFVAPYFEPEMTTNMSEVWGIGSGQEVEALRSAAISALRSHAFHRTEPFGIAGGPINPEGDLLIQVKGGLAGPAAKMALALHRALITNPMPGVSQWFVYGTASLTEPPLIEAPVYQSITRAGGRSVMAAPRFAVGAAEFQRFRQAKGLAAAVAVG